MKSKAAGGVLVRIGKATDDGETFYEVEARKGGKKVSFKVNVGGQVVADWPEMAPLGQQIGCPQ